MDKMQLIKKRNNAIKRLLQTDGLGKVFLQNNWEQINEFLGDCTYLIRTVEQMDQENGAMAEKHAEKDLALAEFMRIVDLQRKETELYQLQETILLERLKKQTLQIKEMKQNSRLTRFLDMAEENLKLAQELAQLKELVKA